MRFRHHAVFSRGICSAGEFETVVFSDILLIFFLGGPLVFNSIFYCGRFRLVLIRLFVNGAPPGINRAVKQERVEPEHSGRIEMASFFKINKKMLVHKRMFYV